MKIPLPILIVVFCLLGHISMAQDNPYVDSLLKATQIQKGAKRFDAYFRLADNYRMNDRFDEAVQTAYVYKTIAQKDRNVLDLVKANAILAHIYTNMDDYKMAQLFQDSAIAAAGDSKDKLVRAYVNYAKMVFYYALDDDEQLSKLAQATMVLTDDKDYFLLAKCSYFLYAVNTFFNDYNKTYTYSLKAIDYAKQSQEMNLLSSGYLALAVAYTYKYDKDSSATKYLDSIMYYTRLAGDCYKQNPGKVTSHTYYMARLNEASYQLKYYYPKQPWIGGAIVDSVQSILDVMKAQKDMRKSHIMASCYGMMASIVSDQGDHDQALTYLKTALFTVDSAGGGHLSYVRSSILLDIAKNYAAKGDYKNAYETQNELLANNAKVFDEKKSKIINQLDAQYQAQKKEQELTALKSKALSQRRMQYLYLSLAVIGIGGMFFMFRSYHFKLKYSLEHQKKLEAEKHDTHLQILLQEEEQARLKAEQQLLELQQQKLRDEVMMSQLQVQHKNEVLHNLKEKLSDESSVNIQQIIREENILDSDFENAKFRVQQVHPNFFKTLNELSSSKLTPLDQKYCAYIYLSMDTKQIAQLLSVEPKSVRMTKYRLKQKFGLEKETDLAVFLKGIS